MVCSKEIENLAFYTNIVCFKIFLFLVQNLQQFLFDIFCIVCLEPVDDFKYLAASGLQWTELIGTFCFLLLKLPIKQLDDTVATSTITNHKQKVTYSSLNL